MRISAMTTRTGVMPQPGSIPKIPRMVPSLVEVPLERWAREYHFEASARQPVDPSEEQPEAADGGHERAGEVVTLALERCRQQGVKIVEPMSRGWKRLSRGSARDLDPTAPRRRLERRVEHGLGAQPVRERR